MSIRRFGGRPLLSSDLLAKQAITTPMIDFLAACIKARINIVISGGTGSGKTTLLNALSVFIPNDERVVTIEDAAELRLQQPHVVRMETRPPNIEGTGEVTTRDLVRNALRMRPDRIIIGECRGPEALDMLQAMNTGHDGSLTTVHANDTRDAMSRLEMMVGMAGFDMPIWIIRRQIASAIHIVVQAARLTGGLRKIIKISEITGIEDDVIACTTSSASSRPAWTRIGPPRAIFMFRAFGLNASTVLLPRASVYRWKCSSVKSMKSDRLDRGGRP